MLTNCEVIVKVVTVARRQLGLKNKVFDWRNPTDPIIYLPTYIFLLIFPHFY